MSYVLGLDLGTSGLKGILVNKSGKVIETVTEDYPLITPERGYSEQNPELWFEASIKVMKRLVRLVPDFASSLEGVSFSGQMHSLVLLDQNGAPLRNAILWNDVRTTKQCQRITEILGEDLIGITKNKALEGFTLPKILWVQENEPEIWEKAEKFLLPKDYIRFKLTDAYHMDYSDAAGTLLLDVQKMEWSESILRTFDIDPELCPELVYSNDQVGVIKQEIADEIGFTKEVPVFAGGADNACGAIGAGIIHQNQAMASIGTSGVFLSYEDTGDKDYEGQLHYFNHAIPDKYYSMGVTLAAGSSLNWFKEQFSKDESFEELLGNIHNIPIGADGLLFAPYISGERTPYTDSKIRGTFIGMDISHTRDHFARAVLEGITFSLKDSQELMKTHTEKDITNIVSVGGGAKNNDWLQIQADIFNVPIVTLATEQGPGMGAAMIAAVGTGWFEDFKECTEVFVDYQNEVLPNPENAKKYEKIYEIYKQIYPTIKNLSHQLVEL